jgi:phosphoserine phosphatase RsbU/P
MGGPQTPAKERRFGSISVHIAATTTFLLALLLVVFGFMMVEQLERLGESEGRARAASVEAAMRELAVATARNLAFASEAALFDRNVPYLQALVERAATAQKNVKFAAVANDRGQVVWDSRGVDGRRDLTDELAEEVMKSDRGRVISRQDFSERSLWIFAAPIFSPAEGSTERIGQARVAISLIALEEELAASRGATRERIEASVSIVAAAAGFLLLIGIVIAVFQGARISSPLARLTKQANQIASGDFSQRASVKGSKEIAHLSESFNDMAERIEQLIDQVKSRAAVERELEIARLVQEALVPPGELKTINNVRITAHYRPATLCGGDWWTTRELADGRLLVLIGDVSGHGLPAAIITAAAIGCCEALPKDAAPDVALRTLNEAVMRAAQERFYMSCFACVLDPRQQTVQFASAGHTHPIVVGKDAGRWSVRSLTARGPMLGVDRDIKLSVQQEVVRSGDVLLFYTDGVTERRGRGTGLFGARRLERVLLESLEKNGSDSLTTIRDEVVKSVEAFANNSELHDDITIVVGQMV